MSLKQKEKSNDHLLILDYDVITVANIKKILNNSLAVKHVNEGQDALNLLSKNQNKFTIILLNLEISDMDFGKLIKEMIRISPTTEIIAYTKEDNTDAAVKAMQAGAFYYITKPFQPKKLRILIDLALDESNLYKKLTAMRTKQTINNHTKTMGLSMARELMAKRGIEGRSLSINELYYLLHNDDEDSVGQNEFQQMANIVRDGLSNEEKPLVLIVDDDASVARSIAMVLRKYYQVIIAENGEMALEIAEKNQDIDVILLDIFMPDYNGVELQPMLKEKLPRAETVVITAYKISDIACQVLSQGACIYLNKPFFKSDIIQSVATALRHKYLLALYDELGHLSLDVSLAFTTKLQMLKDFYSLRVDEGKPVTLKQIFALFPTFQSSNRAETEEIPMDIDPENLLSWLEDNIAPKHIKKTSA